MPFNRPTMNMNEVGGGWVVEQVEISRIGQQGYSVADTNPRDLDRKGLPAGRPFYCTTPTPKNGCMVAMLCFRQNLVQPWHDSARDPFDPKRAVNLTMSIDDGTTDVLIVDLCCLKMPHLQPTLLQTLSQTAAALFSHVIRVFRERFFTPHHAKLNHEPDEEQLVAEGPGGGKGVS